MYRDAVLHLAHTLADPHYHPKDTTRHNLWLKLAKTAALHVDTTELDVPTLIRTAVQKEKDTVVVGELWVALAGYFTRKALFDEAIAVYEHALSSITAVRDFALVFDAYAKFLETLVTAEMDDDPDEQEVENQLADLENLANRRPMLLSDVVLRQNPFNVHEWHKRARMFKAANDPVNVVDTYTKALQTVDPWRATNGRPHTLWLAFARYYEDASEVISARRVLDKAVENPDAFRSPEDMAAVWCEYAEMELRNGSPSLARAILLRAVKKPDKLRIQEAQKRRGQSNSNAAALAGVGAGGGDTIVSHQYDTSSPAWNAYKSRRIWHFLVDLTQSVSSPDDVMDVHQRMLTLRIATPRTILSGAAYLESKRLFEQAFRLYDKGATSIPWPDALQIWVVYLSKFVKRFGPRKLERGRNLFEEAIRAAPSSKRGGVVHPHPQLKLLYLMYADMEEHHSLARHALKVLDRAVKEVRDEDRPDLYRFYVVKMATMFGVTKTRPIYEEALTAMVRPEDVLDFAVRYADMETRLGEIDRARGIFLQTCEIADPRRRGIFAIFWSSWNDFELAYGSEDTFTDMLREKRGVELHHKSVIVDLDTVYEKEGVPDSEVTEESEGDHDSDKVGRQNPPNSAESEEPVTKVQETNQEEIAIDLSDSDEERTSVPTNTIAHSDSERNPSSKTSHLSDKTPDAKLKIVQKELPSGVRNLLAVAHKADSLKRRRESEQETNEHAVDEKPEDEGDGEGKPVGALERFKRRR